VGHWDSQWRRSCECRIALTSYPGLDLAPRKLLRRPAAVDGERGTCHERAGVRR
jgi:hypothetical protein